MAGEIKAHVPALRFPEFEGEWLTQKLSKVLKKKSARNSEGRFSKSDVLSVSGEHGVVNQIAHLGRSYAGESVENYHVVDTGDIVYTKSPLKSNPYGIIRANLGRPGIVSTLYAVYQVRSGHSYDFVNRYFESDDRTNKYLRPLVNKGAKNDMKISNERVLIDPVSFPSIAEQKKIAACLSAIDAKIGAVREKEAALARFKRGLMQALFSRTLRFTRDDGSSYPDWEEKPLQEVAIINPKPDALPVRFNYVDLESVNAGKLGPTEIISSDNAPSRAQRVLRRGDILFQTVRPYQRNNLLFDESGEFVGSTGYAQLRARSVVGFLYQAVHTDTFVRRVLVRCTGTSYPAINSSDLASVPIDYPHPEEQQKIADALSSLDARLTAANEEITRLERFKAGLLQQMFV